MVLYVLLRHNLTPRTVKKVEKREETRFACSGFCARVLRTQKCGTWLREDCGKF
jgi:hypothetical protein